MCSVTLSGFDLARHIAPGELLTSSTLIGRCTSAGLDPVHARQLLRRNSARNGLWRSEKLALQNNGRLFSHTSARGSPGFLAQLLLILARERPGLHRLLQTLLLDEVVLRPYAQMLLASPLAEKKARYPSYETEIAGIEETLIGCVEKKDTVGERLVLKKLGGTTSSSAAGLNALAAFQAEISITGILIEHFRRQNFISWNSLVGNDPPQGLITFNNYLFFAATFSWISPLLRWDSAAQKSKPTPVVFHTCFGSCRVWDVEGFAARIERAGANKTSRLRVLGILAAPVFERNAWDRAKKEGLVAINLRRLFGDAAFEAIVHVQELLKNVVGDAARATNDEYATLSTMLGSLKTNPFIADLKSLAFEAFSGFLVKYAGWEEVQLNLKVPFKLPEGTTEREVDVSGQRNSWDDVCIIECKAEGGNKPLDGEYVRKFFTQTVPAFLAAKCAVRNPSHCQAEIWTTGVVTDTARNALKNISLPKCVIAALKGRDQLIEQLPKPLYSTKRLIETIAALGDPAD